MDVIFDVFYFFKLKNTALSRYFLIVYCKKSHFRAVAPGCHPRFQAERKQAIIFAAFLLCVAYPEKPRRFSLTFFRVENRYNGRPDHNPGAGVIC